MNQSRRRLLAALGSLTAAGVAGCSATDDGSGGDDTPGDTPAGTATETPGGPTPSDGAFPLSTRWLGQPPEGRSNHSHYGMRTNERLRELRAEGTHYEGFEDFANVIDGRETVEDMFPAFVATPAALFGFGLFGLRALGIDEQLGVTLNVSDESDNPDSDVLTYSADDGIDYLTFASDALVLSGQFDSDALASTLTEPTDSRDALEHVDTVGDFDVYAGGGDELAVGLSDSALLYPYGRGVVDIPDPAATVRESIETATGESTRYRESNDAFASVTRAADDGDLVGGTAILDTGGSQQDDSTQQTPSEGVLDGLTHYAYSISYGSSELTGRFAAHYEGSDESVIRAGLEDAVGVTAADRTIDIDGTQAIVTATWPVA